MEQAAVKNREGFRNYFEMRRIIVDSCEFNAKYMPRNHNSASVKSEIIIDII
jgi:hypothetical protein